MCSRQRYKAWVEVEDMNVTGATQANGSRDSGSTEVVLMDLDLDLDMDMDMKVDVDVDRQAGARREEETKSSTKPVSSLQCPG